ncbi:MAG: class I SAM-dependent methyltransferase [Oscillospiraceae bacterium]
MILMNDNTSAFKSSEYDNKIIQTLPHYYDIYFQILDLIKTIKKDNNLSWLDVGCGTGSLISYALNKNLNIEEITLCDTSTQMLKIAQSKIDKSVNCINKSALDLDYHNTFDIVTSVQVNHYLNFEDRIKSIENSYNALKSNGIFFTVENFAPFTSMGENISLERWKEYQIRNGKSVEDSEKHISRYNKDYFPITITQHLDILKSCGFKAVEIFWLSYMQVGFYSIK